MKNNLILVVLAFALISCGHKGLDSVVAVRKANGLVVCNKSLLKDTVELPLSYVADELQIVKIEKGDNLYVAVRSTPIIGDNYIYIPAFESGIPAKLFDKTGKYVRDIGTVGRGPGEYQNVYADIIDEENNRIYMLPWMTDKILVFDMQTGKALDPIIFPSVPSANGMERIRVTAPKGKIHLTPDKKAISVVVLPFPGAPYVAWTQSLDGKMIDSVAATNFRLPATFDNEVFSRNNVDAFDVMITGIDTLYHYDLAKSKMIARFAVDFNGKECVHLYDEWPHHFQCWYVETVKSAPNRRPANIDVNFIVEKESLKGGFYKLVNDYLGNIPIEWPNISNGYYSKNYDPGDLLDDLENALQHNKMSDAMREKLTKLKEGISEDDNNYILYAKLK